MKIAFIGLKGLPSQGGGERAGEAIVRYLADRHTFTVYCDRDYTPSDATIPGVRLLRLPTVRGKHSRMFVLDMLAALHAFFFGNYDLIHIHNAETGFVIPLLRLRYRIVSTSQSQTYAVEKWGLIARLGMRLAELPFIYLSNEITCVTPVLKPHYEQFRAVHVIANGTNTHYDVDVPSALQILQKNHIPVDNYLLFAAGRIIPFKGCHILLQAFTQVDTDAHLVILGDLEQMPEYKRYLQQLADSRVHFIPFVRSQAEVLGLVKQSKLFVFPSTGKEGMSLMLLEVASLGVPLICSDIPHNVAVLADQGFYFASENVADLTDKLRWVLGHPAEAQQIAAQTQQHVHRNFAWSHIAAQYDALYQQVCPSASKHAQKPSLRFLRQLLKKDKLRSRG